MQIVYSKLFQFCCLLLLWNCQSPTDKSELDKIASESSSSGALNTITSFEQWLNNPVALISAHRGGPYPGFPENAIETFQNIANQIPSIIECDVSMTKDSVLVLLHDKTLNRTTTGDGNISDYNYDQVKPLLLIDNQGDTTNFHIPTLDETLAWGKGKVLFTLDVKRGVPFNKVISTVERNNAASYAAIITYRIEDAKLVYSKNSKIVISVSAGDDGALEQILNSGIALNNLLGFVGTSEPEIDHYEKMQKMGIKSILGTLGNLDKSAVAKGNDSVYLEYVKNGANIIATDRPLEVSSILSAR